MEVTLLVDDAGGIWIPAVVKLVLKLVLTLVLTLVVKQLYEPPLDSNTKRNYGMI